MPSSSPATILLDWWAGMFSTEELALIIGLFAVIHHEVSSSLFEEGLWQALLWHHYHRHPFSHPITLRFDWDAHLNDLILCQTMTPISVLDFVCQLLLFVK